MRNFAVTLVPFKLLIPVKLFKVLVTNEKRI